MSLSSQNRVNITSCSYDLRPSISLENSNIYLKSFSIDHKSFSIDQHSQNQDARINISLVSYNNLVGALLIRPQTQPVLFYFVQHPQIKDFIINQDQFVKVYVQNLEDAELVKKLDLCNFISIHVIEKKFTIECILNQCKEKYQTTLLLERLQQESLKGKLGIQCILPFANESIIQQISTILANAVQLDDEYFMVKLGQNFLYDLDICEGQEKQISLQSLIISYFTQTKSKNLFLKNLKTPIWNINALKTRFSIIQQTIALVPNIAIIRRLLKQIKSFGSGFLFQLQYEVIINFKKYSINSELWRRFVTSLQNIKKLIAQLKQTLPCDQGRIPEFFICIINIDESLIDKIISLIIRTLNLERELKVYDDVHQELRRLRSIHNNMEQVLSGNLQNFVAQLVDERDIFKTLLFSIVNVQSLGYLLKVSKQEYTEFELYEFITHYLPEWELCFKENQDLYYRNQFTHQLYDQYGDIENEIELLESKIILQIIKQILYFETDLLEIDEQLSQLDYNISICSFMTEYKLTIPSMTFEENGHIDGGRHLLSEQANNQKFIPNNFSQAPVTVLTGPNFSGKSIFIKQVGLIIYMAHVGLPVPALSAIVPIVEGMYSIFAGESNKLNKFSSSRDILQVSQICQEASKRSFIIIDELGKNLKFDIGSSLFSSTIEFFSIHLKDSIMSRYYGNQEIGPIIILATHYHSIIERDFYGKESVQILDMKIKQADKTLIFTFIAEQSKERRYKSFALEVATHVLNDDLFVNRGEQILEQLLQRKFM